MSFQMKTFVKINTEITEENIQTFITENNLQDSIYKSKNEEVEMPEMPEEPNNNVKKLQHMFNAYLLYTKKMGVQPGVAMDYLIKEYPSGTNVDENNFDSFAVNAIKKLKGDINKIQNNEEAHAAAGADGAGADGADGADGCC